MFGRLSLTLALLAGSVGLAFAGVERAGTTAANFLAVGSGAGVLGMGGATLGLGGDLNTISWNAGSLGWLDQTQFALSHAPLPDQTSQDWAAFGGRTRLMDLRWAVSGLYHGEGSIDGRDALNNPTGNVSASSLAAALNVARPIGTAVTAGLGIKFVNEKLADASGSGIALDAGLLARAGMFGFGVAAQNLGGRMSYSGSNYAMPTSFGLGVGFDHAPSGVRVALDANFPSAYYSDVRGGAEWRWKDMLALRAGYRAELGAPSADQLGGPSFGMGAGAGAVWMDYGYVMAGSNGEHRIGITMRPGSLGHGSEPDALTRAHTAKVKAPKVAPAARTEPVAKQAPKLTPAATPKATQTTTPETAPAPALAAPKPETKAPATTSAAAPAPAPASAPKNSPASAPAPTPASAPAVAKNPPASAPAATPAPAPVAAPAPAPTPAPAAAQVDSAKTAPAPAPEPRPSVITVRSGDTLYSLAKRYGTSVAAFMMENNLVTDNVSVGQKLKVPSHQ